MTVIWTLLYYIFIYYIINFILNLIKIMTTKQDSKTVFESSTSAHI